VTAHTGPIPVPARITIALDSIGAEGPQVDIDLGGKEPMVDQWEAGELVPTREQIERLAAYTGMTPEYFYLPAQDWESKPTRYFICERGRRPENRLTIVESHIDWDGVLQVCELTPPKPPYRPRQRGPKQAPVAAEPAAVDLRRPHTPIVTDTPGVCACGLRTDLPNVRHRPQGRYR
jgi:transcriptional regulator with XRE-family HTH domain